MLWTASLLSNLASIELHVGPAYTKILGALSYSINTLQPVYFPGFAFSWITLISHRLLMPKLLRDADGQVSFNRLLLSLLRFMDPFLRDQQMNDTVKALYTATCKIFLVLLHDFPEFLSNYHVSLCDAIPASCLQLQVNFVVADVGGRADVCL